MAPPNKSMAAVPASAAVQAEIDEAELLLGFAVDESDELDALLLWLALASLGVAEDELPAEEDGDGAGC
jgi:hypothetical protein